jgi:TetR/AcrR family transcriptional repressor of nem operon
MPARTDQPDTRTKLLNAALHEIRARGYSGTSVDDLCRAAGVTKGGFFHHFASKEALAVAAADHFLAMANGLFARAPFRALADPLDRVLGYIDFRASILRGELADFTCLLGTMVQEAYATSPAIRAACDRCISAHADDVARDIEAARQLYAPDAPWTAQSLALFTQATLQGSFVLAKASGPENGPAVAAECVAHLRRYIQTQFARGAKGSRRRAGRPGRPATGRRAKR